MEALAAFSARVQQQKAIERIRLSKVEPSMAQIPKPLRKWVALSYLNAPVQGTTKPLFYQCCDVDLYRSSGQTSTATFLVKALESEETMAREIVGNRIAQLAGLRTPEPAIVFLPRSTAEEVNRAMRDAGRFYACQPGRSAGALQFKASNVMDFSRISEISPQAKKLYAFDMLALHSDRTERNPNCALAGGHLIVYDFERCFTQIEGDSEWPVWLGATNGLGPIHMFYNGLNGTEDIGDVAAELFNEMTDSNLESCVQDLPNPWLPEGRRIIGHVKIVREHAAEFAKDVSRSLAR